MATLNPSVFRAFPILHTRRLLLRDIRLADARAIFQMRSDGRVNQFIARPAMDDPASAEALVERTREAYSNRQAIGWACIWKDGQQIIGTCGFNQIDHPNLRAEIGGELATDYWGQRVALEALIAIVGFGLTTLGLHSIEAKVLPSNRSAIYLLEYLGFRKEAHFHDRIHFQEDFLDMAVYSLIKGKENASLFMPVSEG